MAPSPSLAMHTRLKRLISGCSLQLSSSSVEWHSLSESQNVPEDDNSESMLEVTNVSLKGPRNFEKVRGSKKKQILAQL